MIKRWRAYRARRLREAWTDGYHAAGADTPTRSLMWRRRERTAWWQGWRGRLLEEHQAQR
jgi:hypothetical protein